MPSQQGGGPATSRGRRELSTGQQLSLLTGAVVLAVLATGIVVTGVTLTRLALANAHERMDRAVRQLVSVSATGIRQTQPRYAAVGADSSVRRALSGTAHDSAAVNAGVRAALTTLRAPTDSGLPVELWQADGRRVAFVGDDVPSSVSLRVGGGEAASPAPLLRPGLDSLTTHDSLQLGRLYSKNGRTEFWVAMPVNDRGRTLGFVLKQGRIATNPQTERTIRELSGDSVSGYYHNADGGVWTSFGGAPADAPIDRDGARQRPNRGALIFSEARIAGTPLVLAMEVPERVVIAGPVRTVRRLALFAMVLTIVGALAAWAIGRRVAHPIESVAEAAEALARGNYAVRVDAPGSQETTRLATSFNRMAEQLGESRRELERREEELRALADAIPQLAWMADRDGRIFWFNARWYEYTGFATSDAHAGQWSKAHDPAVLAGVERAWRASIESGEPLEIEVRLRAVDGNARWFLTRVVPVHDGDTIMRWFGTSTDIQAMREAREAAERASRAKSDFLAAMSHELRTPLNAIGGYAELMEMEIRGPISDEQRRDLARIRMSQQHLLGLIGGVLDFSRIESKNVRYAIANVALDPVLGDVEALIAPQAAVKGQTIAMNRGDSDLVVLADREKLRQILLNLLSNAVRHTPSGTMIAVGAERSANDTVRVIVRDNGPGIPLEARESIFEPFVQLDRSLTSTTQGIGLGLAISRDLARGMGGELTVAGVAGAGSEFSLTLPAGVLDATTVFTHTAEMPLPGSA